MVFRELLALFQQFANHSRKSIYKPVQPTMTETTPQATEPTLYDLLAEPKTLGELKDLTGLDYNTLKLRLNRLMLEGLVRDSFDPIEGGLIVLRYHRAD